MRNLPKFLHLIGCLTVLLPACIIVEPDKPNILWLTCEDISPHLGCYGDPDAWTPNLDALAGRGIRFSNAFAPAPVCTPARSSIITGVYASSLGTQHLRGPAAMSKEIRCFTEYLREAGYYCTNNSKEDYNFETPASAWDNSSDSAHWRGRQKGQPFFSVFNHVNTHQSRTRYLQNKLDEVNRELAMNEQHDPASLHLPPYYPDTKIVRQNMAALHTQITLMDKWVKGMLEQLEEDGLTDHTIVFFYSDHGDGLPRHKRWIHATGTRVPMILYLPEKYKNLSRLKPGSVNDELVNFVDLAPTILSLAGLEIPDYMQGAPLLGKNADPERQYIYAIRDRVDEVLEFSRSIRSERYHYIRNFYPHRPRMQRSFFSEITPIRQEIRRMHSAGELKGSEKWLMAPVKPAEELYDTQADPLEMNNLAGDSEYASIVAEMKAELFDWMVETRDLSLIPEADMHSLSQGGPPCHLGQEEDLYPMEEILSTADLVGRGSAVLDDLVRALQNPQSLIRYWGAVGLAALGKEAKPAEEILWETAVDANPCVRIASAEALVNLGQPHKAVSVLAEGLTSDDPRVRLLAVQTLVAMGDASAPAAQHIKEMINESEQFGQFGWYMREAGTWLLSNFEQY
jgi:uncharacterized sulfatase